MTLTLKIDIDSIGVTAALDALPLLVGAEMALAMEESVHIAQGAIATLTPVRTGKLAAAWDTSVRGFGMDLKGFVTNRTFYAKWVDLGTEAHDINPRRKKALFWIGATHPVRGVRHPKTRGAHMAERGLNIAEPSIIEAFRRAVKRAVDFALRLT